MNNKLIVIACLLVSLSIGQVPQFGPEIVIQDGNSPMQPVKYPSPTMVDWDGDGKKDIADVIALLMYTTKASVTVN